MGFLRSCCAYSTIAMLSLPAMAEYPVAGVDPSKRPEGAPRIVKVEKDDAWYRRALTGLNPPYPESLGFLDRQGNWYTPFNNPGMPGRYDIRHWYGPK